VVDDVFNITISRNQTKCKVERKKPMCTSIQISYICILREIEITVIYE